MVSIYIKIKCTCDIQTFRNVMILKPFVEFHIQILVSSLVELAHARLSLMCLPASVQIFCA